jgi:hypothetical protein
MMGVFEEIVKNKEELVMKILQILEGKETNTKLNLDGVEFSIGNSKVSVHGNVEFTIVPFVKKK